MYINEVTLYGRLGKDPELKALPSGNSVVSFTMATTRSWKDDSGKHEQTEWHNVVCFGKRAEVIAQYVKKGDKFYVKGRLQTRSWDDKDTSKKMYRTEIVVEDFSFGDNPKKDGESRGSAPAEKTGDDIDFPEDEINPDDIPF